MLIGNSNSDVGGNKTENTRGNFDAWLVKINSNGAVLWDKTIGRNLEESINDCIQTDENGYVLAISSNSNISGDKNRDSSGVWDYLLLKLTSDNLGSAQFNQTLFSVYPNPVRRNLNIINHGNNIIETIGVYDIAGKLIKKLNSTILENI